MTREELELALMFMQRVQLQGAEVDAFIKVVTALKNLLDGNTS